MLLWWLRHVYWTIQNVLTVRYTQIIAHLKIPQYPTQSDYYSLAIKFNILSLSKFYLFRFVLFAGA